MKLILAEKPSLGREIDSALKKNGIKNYKVLALRGHLVQHKIEPNWDEEPPLSNASVGRNTPFTPNATKAKDADLNNRIVAIKSALNDPKLTEVYSAGDPDAEGSNLVIQVLEYCKFASFGSDGSIKTKKPVKRMIFNDLTDKSLTKSFIEAKDIDTDLGMIFASKARGLADTIVGFNLSRLFKNKYAENFKEKISVGRVQTPTLSIVRERELEIENFIPKDVFKIKAFVDGQSLPFEYSGELDDKSYKTLAPKKGDSLKISLIKSSVKNTKPQEPTDNNGALVFMGNKYKMKPDAVTKLLQSLYEKKITSYPRTDTGFLPTAEFDNVKGILSSLKNVPNNLIIDKNNKNCFNDKKVEAHFGVIPLREPRSGEISPDELKLFNFVKARLIMSLMPDLKQSITVYTAKETSGKTKDNWLLKGSEIKDPGFSAYEKSFFCPSPKIAVVKTMDKGSVQNINKVTSEATKTKPPGLLKEPQLLAKMKTVKIKGEGDNESTSSIGTAATRSSIVTQLIKTGKMKSSVKGLLTTDLGKKIYKIANDTLNLQTTAYFETNAHKIMKAGNPYKEMSSFIGEIDDWVGSVIKTHRSNPVMKVVKSAPKGGFFKFKKGKIEHRIWKTSHGRTFSENEAKKLFAGDSLKFDDLVSHKTGKTYSATLNYNFKTKKYDFSFK